MKSIVCVAAAGACLSVLSFSPGVSQAATASSVQLYGIVDTGLQYLNNGPGGGSSTGLASGNLSGSRWGLQGKEDLGDGLAAVFVLEGGIDVNTGETLQSGRLFGRQSYVGLSDKTWGTLTLGRHNTLMLDWMSKYNPYDNATISAKVLDAAFSDRMDNSIKYIGKMGPVSLGAYYSFGWNNDQSYEDENRGRMFGAGLRYKSGGLDAAVLYHSKHADAPKAGADSDNREDRVVAGMSYDFGDVKLYGGYRWLEQKLTRRKYDTSMYWVGASYRVSRPTRVSLGVYRLNGTACDNMNNMECPAVQDAGSQQKPTLLILGAEHELSKRTTLYANGAYAINNHGSSLSVIGGNYGANVEPGKNQFGANVGMRHRF